MPKALKFDDASIQVDEKPAKIPTPNSPGRCVFY